MYLTTCLHEKLLLELAKSGCLLPKKTKDKASCETILQGSVSIKMFKTFRIVIRWALKNAIYCQPPEVMNTLFCLCFLALERTGHMSFLTGQDQTKSGLKFLNILNTKSDLLILCR